jgi:hypothetical protein
MFVLGMFEMVDEGTGENDDHEHAQQQRLQITQTRQQDLPHQSNTFAVLGETEHPADPDHAQNTEELKGVEFFLGDEQHDKVRDNGSDIDPRHGALEEVFGVGGTQSTEN